ncbi:hypothetical protein [Streptosporangium sp. NPDC001681]|uniref:hypothetical protein n=1 Tax=Streptosporangium sp. NPDC001681 TaxID=3154395 RepID=UPI00333425E4
MSAEIWAAIIAGIALFGSFGAWRTAFHAKQAAAALTAIEARRWHADMTPTFDVTCAREWLGDTIGERALLRIRFTGPPGLDKLTIKVTVRDDWPDRTSILAGGPTQEQIKAQVWGPCRFIHGVDGGSEDGRAAAPFSLLPGDGRQLALDRTGSPHWAIPTDWRQRYDGAPLRLALHCAHGDDKPWTVHYEVPIDETKPA